MKRISSLLFFCIILLLGACQVRQHYWKGAEGKPTVIMDGFEE